MKVIVGIQKSQIVTDNPKLLEALVELYSFYVDGYQYSPAYRKKQWNGKKQFISPKGVFRTGLLPRILEHLKKIDCVPEVVKESQEKVTYDDFELQGITYYDYQKSTIEKALDLERCIISSPTSSGKTAIMAGIVKALSNKKILLLFPKIQLVSQTYEFFKKFNLPNLGVCFGNNFIYGTTMLCTVQSIEKVLDTHLYCDVLMVDEVHEFAKGEVRVEAIQSFPKARYRYGLTATVPSKPIQSYALEGAFGEIIEVSTSKELVEQNVLTKPIIQLIKFDSGEVEANSSYLDIYDEHLVNNEKRNKLIASICSNVRNDKAKILILVQSLEHAKILHELIPNSFKLEGKDNLVSRYDTISKFLKADCKSVLIGTNILQTGVNIEEITHLINARGLKSEISTIQALGRALRRHSSKDVVYIYDILDSAEYLKTHANKRKKYYQDEGHEVIIIK